ncbi:glycosyltransferase family 4 protein [Vibrio cholerae]|uniref:glycosyltransferase family 4 protein n=1 Tax=Vibrio cholerae TaxID=666 RepID=UPI0011D82F40|nr:glycosyltransferase family 4 protein [Vibrio cholerae]EGR0419662.1 glycosyltransferase family 4 protein [Vibrio cholerae]TXY98416.1 glycosyltransferase family 4 protein [Vibrio cholerae]BCN21509.1 putative glycosyltransferase [Vibrio cholerae]GHZ33119.1 glycosyltransferase WbuB [Vibrio cholerae]
MNYLIIATKYGDKKNKWLTNELADVIKINGNSVQVIALSWMQDDPGSSVKDEDGITVYRYKMPRVFYLDNVFVKYAKQVLFPIFAYYKYRKILSKITFERIITFSPAHLVSFLVKKLKKQCVTQAYLVLWDFFPYYLQLSRKGSMFKFLLYFENESYKQFDCIGVMTAQNKDFLLKNYKGILKHSVKVLPIWAKTNTVSYSSEIRKKYNLDERDIIFIYGGAHSEVQELDNLLELAKCFLGDMNIKFIFIGKGKDKARLQEKTKKEKISNVKFLDFVPRGDYELLLKSCDIGLVSLSSRLTVPSFPSKSLDYMKCGLPIIASIDRATDYGIFLENNMKAGFFAFAGDIQSLKEVSLKLVNNKNLRRELGSNGRQYFEENHSVDKIYTLINEHL